jgi:radical SAM superfamily enzyme YgiQ (UPF0313 family)
LGTSESEGKMGFERPEIIRPPSEAHSYFLPLTSGCSNNSCGFCNYYNQKLQLREIEDVKKEIDLLSLYVKQGLRITGTPQINYYIADEWDGQRLFLQDGDALVYPWIKLKETLEYLNAKLPSIERISSYATAQDILRLTLPELLVLKELKLGILYMGVESGDGQILNQINKGITPEQVIDAGRMVKEAGILLSVTVILGLGGPERTEAHTQATASVLSAIDPDYVGALTLTLVPGTPMYDKYMKREFSLISPFESLRELRTIIRESSFTNCFFSSMHASNYYSVRGLLSRDKAQLLCQLDRILSSNNPNLLKPEFLRGL